MKVAEASQTQGTPLEAAIKLGLDTLSLDQTITFYPYVRLVLPLDGFVFWVNVGMVAPSAIYSTANYDISDFNAAGSAFPTLQPITVDGSLHYATRLDQTEDENYSINDVVFTAESKIDAFNNMAPNVLYIAKPDDPRLEGLRFAFSQRAPYYEQANLFHYSGNAIYADIESQIIDDPAQFNTSAQVISNSLPIWLSMNNYNQQVFEPFGNTVPLFPSYLAPLNLKPPFGTVHIAPDGTEALAATPWLGRTYQHSQLCKDKVRVSFYGLNNSVVMGFVDFVNQFSSNWGILGISNMPVVHDEKRFQPELLAIAQKKYIDYEVTYHQNQARNIARQLILKVIPTYIFPDY